VNGVPAAKSSVELQNGDGGIGANELPVLEVDHIRQLRAPRIVEANVLVCARVQDDFGGSAGAMRMMPS
jgi:hypothetical protein